MAIVKSSLSTRGSKHGLMRQETHVEDDSTGYSEKPAESVMISAVIPVFNEKEVIDEFSTRLIESLEHTVPDYEIIFVVEGNDTTEERLESKARGNPRVKVFYNRRRLGLGPATKRGLELINPRTDFVLTMDAD